MKKLTYILLAGILFSCSGETKQTATEEKTIDNIIRLGDAINQIREVNLSELVDSITYLPLETRKECLLRNTSWFNYSPPYIICSRTVFDLNGKFVRTIGRIGQGPGEDPALYMGSLFTKGHFYSYGHKLIEYDENGRFTGNEIQLLSNTKSEFEAPGQLGRIGWIDDWAPTGNSLSIYNLPDTVYTVDHNFKIIHAERVIPSSIPKIRLNNVSYSGIKRAYTCNSDSALFYNYYNDTIYRVKENGLSPRWIIDLGEYKIPNEISLTRQNELFDELMMSVHKTRNSVDRKAALKSYLDNCELTRLTKGKKWINAVYDTDHYIFIIWNENIVSPVLRDMEDQAYPQIAYYDKRTGETVAVKGRGFIDDIHHKETFFPRFGVYDNQLFAYFWPYELHEYIEEKQAADNKVDQVLLDLSGKVDDEDNPIFMIAHLK